jgi:MFS family permease
MWLRHTSATERRTLLAAAAGYGVDGFDYMIYTFIIPTLLAVWGMSKAEAGTIATASLLSSAIGGWGAGVLADRFGRVRILEITVLWFAVFTCLSGFTRSYAELLWTRGMQGFGFGGEWSVGSVLIAETIQARYRGRAAGLVQSSWAVGWGCAAIAYWGVYAILPAAHAWKLLFWMGILPGLLIVYIRRRVAEPPVFLEMRRRAGGAPDGGNFLAIFHPQWLRTTLLASLLSAGMLGAYYSVSTWLPTFLATDRHLSVAGTAGYLLVMIGGSFLGYLASAWLSDALGRRRCILVFAVCGAVLVVAYVRIPIGGVRLLLLGGPLGFFNSGIFAGMGAYLAELYPGDLRGSGQGFAYDFFGRALGALCPALIGVLSARYVLGDLIGAMTAGAYAVVIIAALTLAETRGRAFSPAADAAI